MKKVKIILYVGLLLNILLTIFKILFGILGHSFSLKIDGVNSLLDVIISVLLLISINISTKKADKDHPYGHEKFEVVVSLILGIFIILTSLMIVFTSIIYFDYNDQIKGYTLIVAIISLVIKLIIFTINVIGYKKHKQISLKADAYNHFGDILATTATLIGISVTIFTSFKYFDYIAAIIIAIIIFINGTKVIKESISYLVDESPNQAFNKEVREFILNVDGVLGIDDYKSRMHVQKVYIDVEISVERTLSLVDAHNIAELVHLQVEQKFKEVIHCMVHVNPYNKKIKKEG